MKSETRRKVCRGDSRPHCEPPEISPNASCPKGHPGPVTVTRAAHVPMQSGPSGSFQVAVVAGLGSAPLTQVSAGTPLGKGVLPGKGLDLRPTLILPYLALEAGESGPGRRLTARAALLLDAAPTHTPASGGTRTSCRHRAADEGLHGHLHTPASLTTPTSGPESRPWPLGNDAP